MDRRKTLKQFVIRAKRSLNFEKMLPTIQYGLLLAVGVLSAILLTSRLFVFPNYNKVAILSSFVVLFLTFIYIWWNRVKEHEALMHLDAFYPHNELVTALSIKDDSHPLVDSIIQKVKKNSPTSFERFKKRKKDIWKPRVLVSLLFMLIVIGVLYIFPSSTQQEAAVIEKENNIIEKVKKEVAELEKKTPNEELKMQLQELLNKLKDVELSEEALREIVKKQKELKLQEQDLKEKKELASNGEDGAEGLTAEEEAQLKDLLELQSALANSASTAQTALGKLGKPLSIDLQNAIATESDSNTNGGSSSSSGNGNQGDSSNQNGISGQQSNGQSGQGTANNQSGNNGSQGQGSGSGQGQGNGSGQNGSGSSGEGQGSGTGESGSGAGSGQGDKNLLAIPERIGENGEPIVDGGPLGEGDPLVEQDGPVPVTKGTIRPYEEVIGQYTDRYMESSERMQLPKDLQTIVQSYFSNLESDE